MPSQKKRSRIKAERLRRKQRARRNTLLAIGLGALVLVAAIAIPAIIKSTQPIGEIKVVTPFPRPQAEGTATGDPNAPVKIDVFVDFQCRSCVSYTQQIENRVIEEYVKAGKVYYVFHVFPMLDNSSEIKESDQAANASMCAAEQGRFWDYHDLLFANWNGVNKGAFNDKRLVAFAETLDLDMKAFNACFKANRYQPEIDEELQLGEKMLVAGTPSVYVNGKILTPGKVPTFESIRQAVEAELTQ